MRSLCRPELTTMSVIDPTEPAPERRKSAVAYVTPFLTRTTTRAAPSPGVTSAASALLCSSALRAKQRAARSGDCCERKLCVLPYVPPCDCGWAQPVNAMRMATQNGQRTVWRQVIEAAGYSRVCGASSFMCAGDSRVAGRASQRRAVSRSGSGERVLRVPHYVRHSKVRRHQRCSSPAQPSHVLRSHGRSRRDAAPA